MERLQGSDAPRPARLRRLGATWLGRLPLLPRLPELSPAWLSGLALATGIAGLVGRVLAGVAAPSAEGTQTIQTVQSMDTIWPVVAIALPAFLLLHAGAVQRALCGGGAPWWAIGGQAALLYLPLPLLGPGWSPLCGLLTGAVLVTAGRRRSPLILALALACGPALLIVPGEASAVWAAAAPGVGLAEYALIALAVRARRLQDAQGELVRRTVGLERRRFNRDLHDLVGHRLAVLVLKIELSQRLYDDGDARVRDEIKELLDLARNLTGDVRSVAHGLRSSSLETELSSARAVLESTGVRCQIKVVCRTLPAEAADVLIHVLREGVTNILRHTRARECAIHLVERDGLVRLSMTNDGVLPAYRRNREDSATGGNGLSNLSERVSELGGWLDAVASQRGLFRLAVYFPRNL
ncbi:histidine kinase [Spongiactinospora sp. TRM90649]|uniref:sensor histidine kinase n=1 Tax=Spongiactinospora sp. TRM90649 TaxID=3031114 RepID=UPI0023F7B1E5|nr:histidine kinase [Spongiactinospora sp. TRM90649]MDF5752291.1 histidine kinase [Spongiactinospora sp. TRM90649]